MPTFGRRDRLGVVAAVAGTGRVACGSGGWTSSAMPVGSISTPDTSPATSARRVRCASTSVMGRLGLDTHDQRCSPGSAVSNSRVLERSAGGQSGRDRSAARAPTGRR